MMPEEKMKKIENLINMQAEIGTNNIMAINKIDDLEKKKEIIKVLIRECIAVAVLNTTKIIQNQL